MKQYLLFSLFGAIYVYSFLLCFHNRMGVNMAGFKTNWGYLLVFNLEMVGLYLILRHFLDRLKGYFPPELLWVLHGFFLLSLQYDFLIIPAAVLIGSGILAHAIRVKT